MREDFTSEVEGPGDESSFRKGGSNLKGCIDVAGDFLLRVFRNQRGHFLR